ncbi:formate dehydrogenase accessory sulfurtransferase FdhD [Paremcibacter congregatus]|uniref:formate dehydrogenase accessory sulfurtransferase FdhD n=1 Tax=Paremcibacter congregatus TaxID=2043170 RepID=UPI003A95B2AB
MAEPTDHSQPRIWRPDRSWIEQRDVAREIPLALEYNCVSHAVMMVSPFDLEDFILGFSLTEGIIDNIHDVIEHTIGSDDKPNPHKGRVARLEITPACFQRLDEFKRSLAGRTGCGLCGVDRLEHAIRPLHPVKSQLSVKAEVIHDSMQRLKAEQVQNHITGALHAAAFVAPDGKILCVREDIGRHNALDKLIGHMMRHKIAPADGFALITSRCSFEMVHKCASFGIPVLAAVSATTDLAIHLAQDADLTLVAFARKEGMNIYCDPKGRINLAQEGI